MRRPGSVTLEFPFSGSGPTLAAGSAAAKRRVFHPLRAFRRAHHLDLDDPLGHDIVIDTEQLGPEPAAAAVCRALRTKLRGIG